MKSIRKIGITIIIVVVAFLLLKQLNAWPNFSKWFNSKPVLIENTPLIVESIKDLKELITIGSLDEVVVTKTDVNSGTLLSNIMQNGLIDPTTKRLALIVKGNTYAGINLAKLNDSAIRLYKDSISIVLPNAEIFETVINPTQVETFIEQGQWSLVEINKAKTDARSLMMDRAKQKGILTKANNRGKLLIENFLHSIGFKKVTVITTSI